MWAEYTSHQAQAEGGEHAWLPRRDVASVFVVLSENASNIVNFAAVVCFVCGSLSILRWGEAGP